MQQNELYFPPAELALTSPNGLLAIGGDLSAARLITAYQNGIFPWFNPGEPILWWSPDPRGVIRPEQIKLSRSSAKSSRKYGYHFSLNFAFDSVIRACARVRKDREGTWISDEMIAAYNKLHTNGFAHSIEVWQGDRLVGGLYGVSLGRMFCGESMFHYSDNASKAAFYQLGRFCQDIGIELIDCQIQNPHLASLGVYEIPRAQFLEHLREIERLPMHPQVWHKKVLSYA